MLEPQQLPAPQSSTKPHVQELRGAVWTQTLTDLIEAACEPDTHIANDCLETSGNLKSCIQPGWEAHLPK